MNNNEEVGFYSLIIYQRFRPYFTNKENGYAYKKYLIALKELKLLYYGKRYKPKNPGVSEGECRKYLVLPEGLQLLHSSNVEYLKALHNNKEVIRKTNRNIRERNSRCNGSSDYVLNYIHDGLVNLSYDYEKAMNIVSGASWSIGSKENAEKSLITFREKYFTDLKYNDADGRVFNDFVAMKHQLRQAFRYKNMPRRSVLDIRACHPTFFSSYILDVYSKTPVSLLYYIKKGKGGEGLHYVADNTSSQPYENASTHSSIPTKEHIITPEDIKREHARWVELFSNPSIDPRDVIGKEIGETKDVVKECLNKTLNGHKGYKKILGWIHNNFPALSSVWQTTDKKKTGNAICQMYETKIMLNQEIYRLADELKVKLAYEYDGFSIFSSDPQHLLDEKVRCIVTKIEEITKKLCGLQIILKIEDCDKEGQIDPTRSLKKEYGINKEEETASGLSIETPLNGEERLCF